MKVKENDLKYAKPRLICCIEGSLQGEKYISDVDLGWDELIEEGFDPSGSPLGPVYYRAVVRAGEEFYLSTFMASREVVMKNWGTAGLAFCDPITGLAFVCLEKRVPSVEIMKQEAEHIKQLAKGGNRHARRILRAGRARADSRA